MSIPRPLLQEEDQDFLRHLLEIPCVTPMESDEPSSLKAAQTLYAEHAQKIGFRVDYFEAPGEAALSGPEVPSSVLAHYEKKRATFLIDQPNLVLRLGAEAPPVRTVVFNFHMDTVSGAVEVRQAGGRIFGRGAADCKGPAVALLAGIRNALARRPSLTNEIAVVVQSVSGEEGGAMGTYGTNYLRKMGRWPATLNVVCEPTSLKYFDRTTSSMTLKIEVRGQGSTDDAPRAGENATILLSSIAVHLVKNLSNTVGALGAKMCVAGIHTGHAHNRVYGQGHLLINFAYYSEEMARAIETLVEKTFPEIILAAREELAPFAISEKVSRRAEAICQMSWIKKNLPVLANRNADHEAWLLKAGIERHGEDSNQEPFTCDAMWLQSEDAYTLVLGPGDLTRNHAHAEEEYIDVEDLEAFGTQISNLLVTFAENFESKKFVGESLHRFYQSLLEKFGFEKELAKIGADGIFYSDLRGIDTHGAVNLANIYLPLLESGEIKGRSVPVVATSHGACCVVDGRGALGYVVGHYGMNEAIRRAKEFGIGCAAVRNSTHAGSFGFYTEQAVRENMIGLAFTNLGSQALLKPPGGTTALLGTNVLAAAAPGIEQVPFNLDMSTAIVSSGRIKQFARAGKPVPFDWLVNAEGAPVTAAGDFLNGKATLNFVGGSTGGYKGFGLAMLIDILSGLLSGADVGAQAGSSPRTLKNVGHFFVAMDPEKFVGAATFSSALDKMLSTVLACPNIPHAAPVVYPGVPENKVATGRAQFGVPIESAIAQRLNEAAEKWGIAAPQEVTS